MKGLQDIGADLLLQMVAHHSRQAVVQLVAVFMEHHCVRIPVQLLKAESAVVLLLDLLNCALQQSPHVGDVLLVH